MRQQYLNRSRINTQSSQTLQATSPVLLSTSRCSQTLLELSKVLSDSARACSGALESTCSYGGAFSILQDLTHRKVKFWSSWNLCVDLRETSSEVETAAQVCASRHEQLCGRHDAVFAQQWLLHKHKAFHLMIFVFVKVTRFTTS